MSKIDEVKSRLDIVDVVSDYVELRKSGRSYSAFCPYHSDTRTPSFAVFPETQTWHCFGACGEGGDVFTFIMKRENLTFGEALRLLARRAGVELEPATPEQKRAADQRERLQAITAAAAAHHHDQLLRSPAGEEARAYLQRRELTNATVNRFQLGYAPDQWEVPGDTFNTLLMSLMGNLPPWSSINWNLMCLGARRLRLHFSGYPAPA